MAVAVAVVVVEAVAVEVAVDVAVAVAVAVAVVVAVAVGRVKTPYRIKLCKQTVFISLKNIYLYKYMHALCNVNINNKRF